MVGLAPVPQEKVAAAGPTAPSPQEEATLRVGRRYAKAWGYSRGACHRTGELFAKDCPKHHGPSMADNTGVQPFLQYRMEDKKCLQLPARHWGPAHRRMWPRLEAMWEMTCSQVSVCSLITCTMYFLRSVRPDRLVCSGCGLSSAMTCTASS